MRVTFWIAHLLGAAADGWLAALIGSEVSVRWTGAQSGWTLACFAVPYLVGPALIARRVRVGDAVSFLVMSLFLRAACTLLGSVISGMRGIATVAALAGSFSALGAAGERALPGLRGGGRTGAVTRYAATAATYALVLLWLRPSSSRPGFYLACGLLLLAAQVAAGLGRGAGRAAEREAA